MFGKMSERLVKWSYDLSEPLPPWQASLLMISMGIYSEVTTNNVWTLNKLYVINVNPGSC